GLQLDTVTVNASVTDANGTTTTSNSDSANYTGFTQTPDLTIVKTAATTATDLSDGSVVDTAGQPIAYTITVKNTGNETLTDLTVTDPLDPSAGNVVGTLASLAPRSEERRVGKESRTQKATTDVETKQQHGE